MAIELGACNEHKLEDAPRHTHAPFQATTNMYTPTVIAPKPASYLISSSMPTRPPPFSFPPNHIHIHPLPRHDCPKCGCGVPLYSGLT